FERQINRARKLVPFYEGMRALDIGIGLGHAVLSMQAAGLDVYGIEPSRPFLERATELKKLDKTKFMLVSVEEAELPPSYFDFVTFGAVFEHLFEPAQALEKALNWTKPGGIIHLEVPNSDYLVSKIVNSYFNLIFTNYVTNLSPMHSPFHLFEFTLESFKKHAEQLNYSVADHWIDVCTIRRIPKFLHPLLRWTMERTGTGMQLTVFLRKNSST
ncbi:class I SAM-dependent methyltransferase, partial [Methylocystis suflitae]|uniref:class I SAM-dependent methyltransferase n=1 Tax=Methylocystis suflitae TaxID=2951405 RepID=UPI00210B029A